MALSRPATEGAQPVQRMAGSTLPMSSVSPALANTNSVAAPHAAGPLRPQASTVSPGTQSKLAGTNGTSAVKLGGFGQSPGMQASQEGSQDKQVEQAKLVNELFAQEPEILAVVPLYSNDVRTECLFTFKLASLVTKAWI